MSKDQHNAVEDNDIEVHLSESDMAKLLFAARQGWDGEITEEEEDHLVDWAAQALDVARQVVAILDGTSVPVGTCDGCSGIVVVPVEEVFVEEDIEEYQTDLNELGEE